MSKPEKAGRPFERLVAAVQKKLDPGSEVHSPHRVLGKSGTWIPLDGAVLGKLGSAAMFLAIETKDWKRRVPPEKVRAFAGAVSDAGANHGIIVSAVGFTDDALKTAAHFGLDACVLRPAVDDDWKDLIQTFSGTMTLIAHVFLDASIELADGEVVAVPRHGRVPLARGDEIVTFEGVINFAISQQPELDGNKADFVPGEPLCYLDRARGRLPIKVLRCRREQVEAIHQSFSITDPSDHIYVKLTPTGEVDERRFFEFAELDRIAGEFRKPC